MEAEADLGERVAALEELLELHEETVRQQATRLESQAAELRQSNHALEQFAYVISHDLQEPLRMVAAYTELLRKTYRGQLDEQADKYIDFASGGAIRMQELINALLDYSRVTTRGKALEPTSLEEVVDDVLLNLKLAISESAARISREELPVVWADRPQLLRLVQNLVANALKFHEPDRPPEIQIGGQRQDRRFCLVVKDHGIGIDPRHHKRIFEIFKRVHPKRFAGTGMGLSICQRIAEHHGSEIRVDSAAGAGAAFSLVLKLAERP